MSYLLDTNVLSELRKPKGNPKVKTWFAATEGEEVFLSVLVVGEIQQGVERLRRRDPVQAAVFDVWLETLKRDYRERILPITAEIAEVWGRFNASNPLPVIDGLLAATAQVHGLILVTRNVADIDRTGVPLLNPFG
ncbi:MAG: type II toxin-antitoxin system VapC family toxin [Trueperaceae bacterium]|nr:MAG: type II toxin-antitoxin system VapC family toxin [Trueperaceae bacterium]